MERKNGYLILDDLKQIEKEKSGHHICFWFSDKEQEYFFKVVNQKAQLKELFYSTLLLENGYDAAKCDLATFQNQQGIVSPTLNPNNFPSFTLEKIIDKYLKTDKYKNQKLYNLEKINELLELEAKDQNCFYSNIQKRRLLLYFIMQILLGNSDLRSSNLEIMIKNEIVLFPFYDFELCGEITLKLYEYFKNYLLKYDSKNRYRETPLMTLQIFLEEGSREEIEYFRENLSILRSVKPHKIFKICEEKTETSFSLIRKIEVGYRFKQNLKTIYEIIKKQ